MLSSEISSNVRSDKVKAVSADWLGFILLSFIGLLPLGELIISIYVNYEIFGRLG